MGTTINVPDDYDTIQAALNAAQSGDTVLVQSGTYYENIIWPDMNGIKLLSAGDTSNTVIDGSANGSVIDMNPSISTIDSTTEISGFKITNGNTSSLGGGMTISNASPVLRRLWITGNTASGAWLSIGGGGIYISDGSPALTDVTVSGNTTSGSGSSGGGIKISGGTPRLTDVMVSDNMIIGPGSGGGVSIGGDGSPILTGVTVTGNTASSGGGIGISGSPILTDVTVVGNTAGSGGGIYISDGSPTLTIVTMTGNLASSGGGLYIRGGSPTLTDVTVTGNRASGADGGGGGIYIWEGNPTLRGVTITGNTANYIGGGIYFRSYASPSFDPNHRCSIYFNFAAFWGSDLYALGAPVVVVVDTFTVMNPTEIHAVPVDNFTFDILHAKVEQVEADLYVDAEGDNANTGLSPAEPLRTISVALLKILADSLQPRTIYLADGIYSPSMTGEGFPLGMLDYVSLSGESESGVILDGEGQSGIMVFFQDQGITIENLTITGGFAASGGGLYIYDNSNPTLTHVTVTGNTAYESGGGLYIFSDSLTLTDVTVSGNTAHEDGGGLRISRSSPTLSGVTVNSNTAYHYGGGLYFSSSSLCFDTVNRSNIYHNHTGIELGQDLYAWVDTQSIHIVVDTFTVMHPTDVHAYPVDNFTFDILNAKEAPGASEKSALTPSKYALHQNYPNPFNPVSTIRYDLPRASDVSLIVYDILGREVARLVDGYIEPGYHQTMWDSRDAISQEMASGIYIARLTTPEYTKSIKMLLLK
ncbi:MAG: T9SS type A sorting domain-containing protein [Fidelibacterota bacterium]|nr:MAG: T9SS type A sorting domain-containing protein [Candidatus Neomarinimicrobiota bacterium]